MNSKKSKSYFERMIEQIVEDDVKELEPILLSSLNRDEDNTININTDQPVLI